MLVRSVFLPVPLKADPVIVLRSYKAYVEFASHASGLAAFPVEEHDFPNHFVLVVPINQIVSLHRTPGGVCNVRVKSRPDGIGVALIRGRSDFFFKLTDSKLNPN